MFRILFHICCAPCLSGTHDMLLERGIGVDGFYFNPNIQPYSEWQKRLDTIKEYVKEKPFFVYVDPTYEIGTWLRKAIREEDAGRNRCAVCIKQRLEKTAEFAKEKGYRAFSTTLLLSTYQPHLLIKDLGEEVAKDKGVEFFYEDFRVKWSKSLTLSRKMRLYRQQYCGCVLSEQDRYLK